MSNKELLEMIAYIDTHSGDGGGYGGNAEEGEFWVPDTDETFVQYAKAVAAEFKRRVGEGE